MGWGRKREDCQGGSSDPRRHSHPSSTGDAKYTVSQDKVSLETQAASF